MDDMIERVARAMYPDWFDENITGPDGGYALNNYPNQHLGFQERARKQARVAIEAMRKPTQAMVDAAMDADGTNMPMATGYDVVWGAMVDAAITSTHHTPIEKIEGSQ